MTTVDLTRSQIGGRTRSVPRRGGGRYVTAHPCAGTLPVDPQRTADPAADNASASRRIR